jgi:hypothetical protein
VDAPDLEVVGIMAGGDLESPRAELRVDVLIRDHRQSPADQRQDRVLGDHAAVANVGGIHRDGGVGEHRLRAHSGNDQLAPVLQRICDLVESVGHLAVLYL